MATPGGIFVAVAKLSKTATIRGVGTTGGKAREPGAMKQRRSNLLDEINEALNTPRLKVEFTDGYFQVAGLPDFSDIELLEAKIEAIEEFVPNGPVLAFGSRLFETLQDFTSTVQQLKNRTLTDLQNQTGVEESSFEGCRYSIQQPAINLSVDNFAALGMLLDRGSSAVESNGLRCLLRVTEIYFEKEDYSVKLRGRDLKVCANYLKRLGPNPVYAPRPPNTDPFAASFSNLMGEQNQGIIEALDLSDLQRRPRSL